MSMDARWHPGLGKQAAKENGLSPDATYQVRRLPATSGVPLPSGVVANGCAHTALGRRQTDTACACLY